MPAPASDGLFKLRRCDRDRLRVRRVLSRRTGVPTETATQAHRSARGAPGTTGCDSSRAIRSTSSIDSGPSPRRRIDPRPGPGAGAQPELGAVTVATAVLAPAVVAGAQMTAAQGREAFELKFPARTPRPMVIGPPGGAIAVVYPPVPVVEDGQIALSNGVVMDGNAMRGMVEPCSVRPVELGAIHFQLPSNPASRRPSSRLLGGHRAYLTPRGLHHGNEAMPARRPPAGGD